MKIVRVVRCGTVFLAITGVAGKVLLVEEYIFIDPFVVRKQGTYEFTNPNRDINFVFTVFQIKVTIKQISLLNNSYHGLFENVMVEK